jgi:hypothetical protein
MPSQENNMANSGKTSLKKSGRSKNSDAGKRRDSSQPPLSSENDEGANRLA